MFKHRSKYEMQEGIYVNNRHGPATAAAIIAEPTRMLILELLMDGRPHTAGEIASHAHVSPQTASFHLAKMKKTGWVSVTNSGRHRYYRLIREDVAEAVERLLNVSPPNRVVSLRQSKQLRLLRLARTCYDHLAGRLGVELAKAMVLKGVLDHTGGEYLLAEEGEELLQELGVRVCEARKKRRSFARACLDWSEGDFHLAGALGAALLERFFELMWVRRKKTQELLRSRNRGKRG
jgi:DNA-binding transcriptional ArsR family regulator